MRYPPLAIVVAFSEIRTELEDTAAAVVPFVTG